MSLAKSPSKWTIDETFEWIRALGFKELAERFRGAKVNGAALVALNGVILSQMFNIKSKKIRKRLLDKIRELKESSDKPKKFGTKQMQQGTATEKRKVAINGHRNISHDSQVQFCFMDPAFAKFKRTLPDMKFDRTKIELQHTLDEAIIHSEAFMPWPEGLHPNIASSPIPFPKHGLAPPFVVGQKRTHDESSLESRKKQANTPGDPVTPPIKTKPINPNSHVKEFVFIDYRFVRILKKHQLDGVRHMWRQVVESNTGCILAHAMGLGKSLQAIVFITTLINEISLHNPSIPAYLRTKRILILAPLITLDNWMNELYQWIPSDLQSMIGHIYNFCDASISASAGVRKISLLRHWYNDGGILLMNYDQFRACLSYKKSNDPMSASMATYLLDPGPALVIADEGHRIKNQSAQITTLINRIRTPARICLTGYPLQNNLIEYYCMIDFVCPGFLGGKDDFKRAYTKPIENVFADSPEAVKYDAKCLLFKLQLLTVDIIQRRDVDILRKDLPMKKEYTIMVRLTSIQYDAYDRFLKDMQDDGCDHSPLIGLILLRAICNHPSVFKKMLQNRHENKKKSELELEQGEFLDEQSIPTKEPNQRILDDDGNSDGEIIDENEFSAIASWKKERLLRCTETLFQNTPDIDNPAHSNKLLITAEIAKICKSLKEKLIIVSHSLACLDYIQQYLSSLEYNVSRIDGQTPQAERQPRIDQFNKEPNQHVLLLSAKAGSIGVNIVGASRLILFDMDWNPCHGEQSIARIYRYGQTKPVHIYRLVTYSTIEQRVMAQSIHKRGISSRVVDNRMMAPQLSTDLRHYYTKPMKDPEPISNYESLKVKDKTMKKLVHARQTGIVDVRSGDEIEYAAVDLSKNLDQRTIKSIRKAAASTKKKYISTLAARSNAK
ncbi:hypothetical protein DFQ28_002750 [Apophysomyces sp. BC1034]|nr:hypothetical protein DFQ30_005791 [Apophysomyces sp. BC1015]KAG0182579.1 hypothetical protein DFQ29_003359 [Apophysomyces sp. BC1021]KAG0193875.1 hypothetical protein DFQ28_002750 [Apophysomyces sp. BC1034]